MKIQIELFSSQTNELERGEEGIDKLLSLVASNPLTPDTVLNAISKKQSPMVLCEVASNEHVELSTLEELSNDPHPSVRACVADHPKAINLMWKLVKDESPLVRYGLASNTNLPEHIFSTLAKDEDYRVARRARRSLRELRSRDSIVHRLFSVFGSEKRAS